MKTEIIEINEEISADYQMIRDEHLAFQVVSSQILAGSKVILSSYQHMVFSESLFYACDFQGVTFENCVFENCSFEFSHFRACRFKNCNFTNCTWSATSSINTVYEEMDEVPAQTEWSFSLPIAC